MTGILYSNRSIEAATPSSSPHSSTALTTPFVDQLLLAPSKSENPLLPDELSILKAHDLRVPSSGLAFFSESKLNSLVQRIGNPRLKQLINGIDHALKTQVLTNSESDPSLVSGGSLERNQSVPSVTPNEASIYIKHYFENFHPIYPFLDQQEFEEKATSPDLSNLLHSSASFSALYHSVLAIGCQYYGGGSFAAGDGKAWSLFEVSLRHMGEILTSKKSLCGLQALIAMSIFSMTEFKLQMDSPLINYATVMVLALRYHTSALSNVNGQICYRAFWVVYQLEKHYRFLSWRGSIIADYDIGCPIPRVPESMFGDYHWMLSSVRFCRILSIAYASLFSVTASTKPVESQLAMIEQIHDLLEDWRVSIPLEYRPGEPIQRSRLMNMATKQVTIQTHYYYHHLIISLERLTLQIDRERGRRWEESKYNLLNAARAVVELIQFIDVAPYTPVFILGTMPLTALFILFDFVIHNPEHSETRRNLVLLDVISGHFSLLEHASNGSLPANYLSEFAHIAQRYVEDWKSRNPGGTTRDNPRDKDDEGHMSVDQEIQEGNSTVHPNNTLTTGVVGETISQSESDNQESSGAQTSHLLNSSMAAVEAGMFSSTLPSFDDPNYLFYIPDNAFLPYDEQMMDTVGLGSPFGSLSPYNI